MLPLLALAALAAQWPHARLPPQPLAAPNVVVVILDDAGIDQLAAYGIPTAWGEAHARTPVLDHLRSRGVLFQRAWASPLCSPSRAMLLTGRHGFRTGMLHLSETPGPCPPGTVPLGLTACCPTGDPQCAQKGQTPTPPQFPGGYALPEAEVTLAEALRDATFPQPTRYARGAFGKWHLSGALDDLCHPIRQGFELFQGHLRNNEGQDGHHFDWLRVDAREAPDGCTATTSRWVGAWDAEVAALDARQWIDAVRADPEGRPFLAVVSLNPPHQPFQVPPQALVSPETWSELVLAGIAQEGLAVDGVVSCNPTVDQETGSRAARLVFRATIEAVDALLGRVVLETPGQPELLDDTIVFVVGDNGTPDHVVSATQDPGAYGLHAAPFPPRHAKRSIYELGVRVPLIVAGRGVTGAGTCDALVSIVDLWPTVLECCHADVSALVPCAEIDGRSFRRRLTTPGGPLPGLDRGEVYTEMAARNGLCFEPSANAWTPCAPGGTVKYERAILGANGFKYVRRVVGAEPGCSSPAWPCAPWPSEEVYQVFDDAGWVDPFEATPACGTPAGDAAQAALRQLMLARYFGG